MGTKPLNIFFTSISVLLIHILFVSNINFFGLINPQILPVFLLLLSRNIPSSVLMIFGFVYALIADIFTQTMGVSIIAMVFICFFKPFLLSVIYNRDSNEMPILSLDIQGPKFILRYLGIALLVYHFIYFLVEIGNFYNFIYIVLKTILSTFMTLLMYISFMLLFTNQGSKKDHTL